MPPALAVHVTSDTIWLTGPSSVCTGLAKFLVLTLADHPGTGRTFTVSKGRSVGRKTWTVTVLALSRSFGTRKVNSMSWDPAGKLLGWTVTCAQAGRARTSVATTGRTTTTMRYPFLCGRLENTGAVPFRQRDVGSPFVIPGGLAV